LLLSREERPLTPLRPFTESPALPFLIGRWTDDVVELLSSMPLSTPDTVPRNVLSVGVLANASGSMCWETKQKLI